VTGGPATTSKASPGIGWRWLISSIVWVQRRSVVPVMNIAEPWSANISP
jgi:hypothetical protein